MRSLTIALVSIPFLVAASSPGALEVTKPDGTAAEMPLRHTKVAIEVSAFVQRAVVEQTFDNPFDEPVEAVYTFPLGDRAAIDDFELIVGDRTIRGRIERREEARAIYETARSSGLQAALLDQERPNVFTQSVANLEPHRPITVRLRTVETLRYERGVYRLTFPLVVGPRYLPASVPDKDRVRPPVLAPGTRSAHDVEIAVTIDAGVAAREIVSGSHEIVVERPSPTRATVRLAESDTLPNKDFLLRWSVGAERPATGILTHRSGLDGFFTLLLQPKGEVGPQEAAPKEIVFVVDTSGSMSGIPLEASKRLVAKALHELGPRDTFNLVRFSGDNEVYAKDPLPNDRQAVESAIRWLAGQHGGGGTEMLAAFRAVFERPTDPDRLRLVVFLTDGYVGNDNETLAEIRRTVGRARIYTVGIGSAPNHFLLDRMADLGGGAYVPVRADESADDALSAFRSWVTKPYLTDLSIDWGALPVADLTPDPIRDLGSGQTLTLLGRYVGQGEGDIVLRGKLGGRYWEQRMHVVLPEREMRHDAIASLWARGRIEEMLSTSPGAVPDAVAAEVTALALEHRLMTSYTSFVAVDDARVVNPNGQPRIVRQAVPLPEGMDATEARQASFHTIAGGNASNAPLPRAEAVMVAAEKVALDLMKTMGGAVGARRVAPPPAACRAIAPLRADVSSLDAALRVLADLAEDGKLSPSDGQPALEALLAWRMPSGALSEDPATHAIATWALSEAAVALPKDTRVAKARDAATARLAKLSAGEDWVRLVRTAPVASGAAGLLAKLRPAEAKGRHTPLDRLIASIGRGRLRVIRS